MKTVQECLDLINRDARRMLQSNDNDQLTLLQSFFRDLETASREEFQEKLFPQAEAIYVKLQAGSPLDQKEKKILELLIIGDAEFYTKFENNYDDWMREFERLMDEIGKYRQKQLTVSELCHLRAQARDLLNLLPSIVYYLQARNRVERFRQTLRGELSREDYFMLASIVKTAMESPLQ